MKMVLEIKKIMNKALSIACAILLGFMSLLAVYQVFMRYVLRNPSTISEDILSYSFVWVSLLATALVFGERDHMNLTFFLDKMPDLYRLCLSVFSEILIIAVAAVIFIIGGRRFMDVGAMQVSPTLNITMNFIYLILPICGILIGLYGIINIMELINDYIRKKRVN